MPAQREVPQEIAAQICQRYVAGERIATLGSPWGYDYKTTRRVLVANGVTIRNVGGRRAPLSVPVADVLGLHSAGLSCNQIAKQLGTYPNKVANLLRDNGHEPADGRTRRGAANPLAKKRRHVSKEGYVTALLDPSEYHLRGSRTSKGNSMLEHRLVMARHLGRALYDYENVHHINGDRADNRLENLELWEKGQPPGQRAGQGKYRQHCPTCTCCK
jgi:hypothetical protein